MLALPAPLQGVWVWLHALLENGALLAPGGAFGGMFAVRTGQRHESPSSAVTPPPPPVRIILSASLPTQKRCWNRRALVYLYCTNNIAGATAAGSGVRRRLQRALVTTITAEVTTDPPRVSHLHP